MNKILTLISLFDQNSLNQINNIIQPIHEPLCKVQFGKNIDDRPKADTLPYHFTLTAGSISNKEITISNFSKISFNKFKILVDSIGIMNGKENSYVLCFNIKENKELKLLQEKLYNILPSEKYKPNNLKFHITITIDKDYEKIINIKTKLESIFKPFELDVTALGLYEIYPAKLLIKIYCID